MIEIPKFVPKIIEEHYDHIVIYDTIEQWVANRQKNVTYTYNSDLYVYCTRCASKHHRIEQFNPHCMTWQSEIDHTVKKDDPLYYTRRYKSVYKPHPHGHSLKFNVNVRDELGDPVTIPETDPTWKWRWRGSFHWWMNESSCSPRNRGLLPVNYEVGGEYYRKYRHYDDHYVHSSWFRNIRTTNERRQYDACMVDEHAPKIRGRRSKSNLPNSWDDLHAHRDRSWKRRKVRKQWMVNLV